MLGDFVNSIENFPLGEVCVAPLRSSAKGRVRIDGSFPGRAIHLGRELLLSVQKGQATCLNKNSCPASLFWEGRRTVAERDGDLDWNQISEIGFGLNKRVTSFSGSPTVDEKMYGSAHIAIGYNEFIRGTIKSKEHLDFVMKRPTVVVDGKTILKNGRLKID